MKILHVITRLDRGGSAENTLLSAIGLAEKGYSVDVLYGFTKDADERLMKRAIGAGVIFLREDNLLRNIHPIRDFMAFYGVLGFIRKGNYDIVHVHSHKAGLIGRFAAKCARVKKVIYTPHGHVFYGYFGNLLTGLIIFSEKVSAHLTDTIVALTDAERDEWLKFGIGRKELYTVIPSGIEFDNLELEASTGTDWRRELGVQKEGILIGALGRFIEIKGFNYLIDAASILLKKRANLYFLLAGDGPLVDEYKRMITGRGMSDRFHIIPWQENTGSVIKALDIFVLPSLNEGMGRVLAEAMFFGKTVIATRVGGVPSVVSDGAGILIEPSSAEAIASAVDDVLSGRKNAAMMREKAHEKALSGYSAERMVELLDELYRRSSV